MNVEVKIPENLPELTEEVRKRFYTTVKLKEPDRVPAVPYIGSAFMLDYAKMPYTEWYGNPKTQFATQLKFIEYAPDTLAWRGIRPHMGYVVEGSAFLCPVEWPEVAPPHCKPIIREPSDVKKLQVPDPKRDGLMPKYLEAYRFFQDKLGSKYTIDMSESLGPVTLASILRGITPLMADLYQRPNLVHKLMEITTEAVSVWLKAQDEVLGGTIRQDLIRDDIINLLSVKFYDEFVMSYYRRLFSSFPSSHLPELFTSGNTTHILERIADAGIQIHSCGPEVDVADAKRRIGKRLCLIGNIMPLKLRTMKPREVEAASKNLIYKAGKGGGFCLGTAGAVTEKTPLANIVAMVKAAKKHGKYPIGGDKED